MFYYDYYYLVLVVPTLILSLIAQGMVQSAFRKYSSVQTKAGISGREMAQRLLSASNINNVKVAEVAGSLTDHYDPSSKVLRLSQPVFNKRTVAAVGVAAHEIGHAIQDKIRYSPLVLRSTLVPLANIGSAFGPVLACIGFFLRYGILIDIGIILFACAVLFYIITLPVEIDASRRALKMLKQTNLLEEYELSGVRSVLTAAAFTYVASALTAIASLVRLILIAKDRK